MLSHAILLVAALATTPAVTAATPAMPDTEPIADEARVGPYVVRVLGGDDEQWCRVIRDGRLVLETPLGGNMRIGRPWATDSFLVAPGTDVNADGTPDVTLWDWSGGAHCCYTVTVLSLGDSARVLAVLETGNTGAQFENLDADPALEVVTADDVFAYWPSSFASSAAPRVVLKWSANGYVASPPLTHHAVRADSAMAEARRLRRLEKESEQDWSMQGERGERAAEIMRGVVELLYAGHPDLALEYLDAAWPDGHRAYRDRLLGEFVMLLLESPYWRALEPPDGAWR